MSGDDARVEELQQRLHAYIAKEGLKSSKQRDAIVDAFFRAGGHLSVDELLQRVREVEPKVSQATVYRTMNLLREAGLAEARQFFETQTLYELADPDEDHHDHLICRTCGRIFEFVDDDIEKRQLKIAKDHGFTLKSHRMVLYGECNRDPCPDRER